MNENTAIRLMAQLITTTNGWDDASVEQWTQLITDLSDTVAAQHAADTLMRTWTHGNRPTWAKFLEHYEAGRPRQHALPPPRDYGGVSIGDHLRTLQARIGNGDRDAGDELETWRKHMGHTNTWLRYVDETA
jgi:hypothetical protein